MKLDNAKVKAALDGIVEAFKTGSVPDAIAHAVFSAKDGQPSDRWSLLNQLTMLFSGTKDARGYRQWQEVGRQVKKGAKAIYILGPIMKKITAEDKVTGDKVTMNRLVSFKPIPVFAVEDTEGDPLPEPEPFDFPLMEVAEAWSLDVHRVAFNPREPAYGWYSPNRGEIGLATPDAEVFFHELSHAAHGRVLAKKNDRLVNGQDARQEIVAEMCSAVIARLFGCRTTTEGNAYKYVEAYAKRMDKDVPNAVLAVLHDVQEVLAEVTEAAEKIGVAA